jgi:flavin-dependent dehydrogenase
LIKFATNSGAEIRTNERFIKYQVNKTGEIEIITDKEIYLSKFLIAADGVNSTVLNQLGFELPNLFQKKDLLLGVVTELPFENNDFTSNNYPHLFFDFINGIDYGWAFPNKETFNVGFGYKINNNIQINANNVMKSFVKNILHKSYSNEKLSGGLLPIFWSNNTPNIQFGHIILIGDSAGFVDEWTGEGIYYAIKSAINAFNVLDLYFTNGNNSNVLNRYTQLCMKDFYSDLRFSHYFANIFRKNTKRYKYLQYKKLRSMFIPFAKGDLSYRFAIFKALPYVLIKKYFTQH